MLFNGIVETYFATVLSDPPWILHLSFYQLGSLLHGENGVLLE
jgi:hypothetical protein